MEPRSPTMLAVLLAAGGGSRFRGPSHKLLAHLDGETVAALAIRHALDAAIGPLLIVTGAVDLGSVIAAVDTDQPIDVVHNPNWADGQAASLQVAVAEATRREVEAIVVGLADQPFVPAGAWRLVADSDSAIAVGTYGGAHRNPVRLDRSVWHLLPTSGDQGARVVARLRPELVQAIPCPGSAADIDTLEDLETWQNRSSTNSP